MNTRVWLAWSLSVLILLPLVAACSPTAAPATFTPTATLPPPPTATATATATATPTPAPTATSAPTPTPTPKSAFEELDPRGQTITYWHPFTGATAKLLTAMVEDFNRANPERITVVEESQGGYTDLYDKILAGISRQQLPAVALAYPNQAAVYAAQGALVALDAYAHDSVWGYREAELADFFPIVLEADVLPQFGGRYGWPFQKSMEVLFYNEEWLKELGAAGPPETWAAFEELACQAVQQPFSKQAGPGAALGYEYSVDASRFAAFVFSRGGELLNAEATGFVFNDAVGLETLTFWQGLVAQGCAAPTRQRYGDQADFGAGRVLFTTGTIAGLYYYRQEVEKGANFAWNISPLPHSTAEPRLNIYGPSHSIFVGAPEQQLAAWIFLKWLSEPEQQARWASHTGYLPIRRSAAPGMQEYLRKNPMYARALEFMTYDSGVEPPVVGYEDCRTTIYNMLRTALGGADAQTELDKAVKTCNGQLQSAP